MVRCPSCRRFFCKECVSEHEDRFLCASCLAREAAPDTRVRPSGRNLLTGAMQLLAGLALLWLLFFLIGNAIRNVPDTFHQEIQYELSEPAEQQE